MLKQLSDFYDRHRSNERFWLFVALAAGCLVMLPMPLMGVPEGYDIGDHLRFAAAYRESILNGSLTAPWTAAANYGFGSVGTRFYPPLADLLTGIVGAVTNDWYDSFLITAFFWMIPGCLGMYLWAREFVDPARSAAAAVLFVLMPYHLFQIYQFTLFSEFAAASVLPFCFLCLTRLARRGSTRDVILFAISYSVLILTHIPSTITGTITLAVYALFIIDWAAWRAVLVRLLAAGAAAAAATAYFWIKLVTELDWVAHNSNENVSGAQAYSYHLFPIIFTAKPEFYWPKMMWLVDSTAIFTILALVPVIAAAAIVLRRTMPNGGQRKLILGLAASGLVLILIVSVPGKFVWDHAPVLSKIQFPWRFLSPASIVAAMSFVVAVPVLYSHLTRFRRVTVYSVVVLLSAIVVFDAVENIISSAPYSRALFEKEYGGVEAKKGCSCWFTAWGNEAAFLRLERVDAGTRTVIIDRWEPLSREFQIGAGEAASVRIATFWYPHWRATVNGEPVELGRDDGGAILVPIPDANSHVRLYFEQPALIEVANYFSLAAWIVLFAALVIVARRKGNSLKLSAVT